MNIIKWIKDKKKLENCIDRQEKTINTLKMQISKMHNLEKEKNIIEERELLHIDTIKELKKEIRKLKKEIKK